MNVYHYARARDWKEIKKGSYRSGGLPGLGARHRVGTEDVDAWNTGAVFCFLDPIPPEWVHNEHFKLTWDAIKHDIGGRMLLEINLPDDDSNSFVIDRGLAESPLYKDKSTIPEQYIFTNRREAESAYLRSKIPLKEYLEKREQFNFSLPEVIITEHVSLDKIKISDKQPLLDEDLEKYKNAPAIMRSIMSDINSIPELLEWYRKRNEASKEISDKMMPKFR
jgi:hypothetical protein